MFGEVISLTHLLPLKFGLFLKDTGFSSSRTQFWQILEFTFISELVLHFEHSFSWTFDEFGLTFSF